MNQERNDRARRSFDGLRVMYNDGLKMNNTSHEAWMESQRAILEEPKSAQQGKQGKFGASHAAIAYASDSPSFPLS